MYIPGRNPTIEAIKSPLKVRSILIQQDIREDEKISEILSAAKSQGIEISEVSRKKLNKLANNDPHQGVIADVEIDTQKLGKAVLSDNPGMYLYIREAQYEHNVGAIIRTAEAAGIAGVILPPRQELTPTIARISMGAVFHIPLYSSSLFPTIKMFKQASYMVSAIEINGDKTIYDADLTGNQLLIVGGEDKSISPQVAKQCDQVAQIPQFGQVNSLNMSVAAALAIYEHVRQSENFDN